MRKSNKMSSRDFLRFNLNFWSHYVTFSFIATAFHEYVHYLVLHALGGEGEVYFKIEPVILPWDASTTLVQRLPSDPLHITVFSFSGGAVTAVTLLLLYLKEKNFANRSAIVFVMFHQAADAISEPLLFPRTPPWMANLSTQAQYQVFLAISIAVSLLYIALVEGKRLKRQAGTV